MVRKLYLAAFLLLTPFFLTGCIDTAVRYLVRQDGSTQVTYDVRMDKSILQLLYAAQQDDPDAVADAMSLESSSGFQLTKAIADSIRSRVFAPEVARLGRLPQVRGVTSRDSVGYEGLHYIFTVELNSYKDIDVLRALDTGYEARIAAQHEFHLADSVYIREQGDSVMFMVADLTGLASHPKFPALPITRNTQHWYKLVRALMKHEPTPALKGVRYESADADDDMEEVTPATMLSSMMAGFLNIHMTVESPLLIGHDPSADYNAETQTASWHLDLGSFTNMNKAEQPSYYVWFKKPGKPTQAAVTRSH